MEWYVVERGERRFREIGKLMAIKPEVERLYVRGKWDKGLFARTVAVVGSRRCSQYGRRVVKKLVREVVKSGYTTVSGFMYGIDIEVHRNTYLSGGRTIAVWGWGIEKKLDTEMNRLIEKLIESGGLVVSEYEGRFGGNKISFPKRNRIVAGLADEVVVVEAGKKSGTMNTVRWARKMGKRVWAVPGSVLSEVSEGTNELIKKGWARMWTFDNNFCTRVPEEKEVLEGLSAKERAIVVLLQVEGVMGVSELVGRLGWEAREVMGWLMKLEMKGVVREVGSGWGMV